MKDEIEKILQRDSWPSNPGLTIDKIRNKKLIIYGAGNGYITFSLFILKRFKLIPYAILDKKFTQAREHIKDILCCAPEHFHPSQEIKDEALVIVTIGNPSIRNEIFHMMHARGFSHVISAMDIYEYHLPNPNPNLSHGFSFFHEQKKSILAARDLFQDEKSLEIYQQFLLTHLCRQCLAMPQDKPEDQYFPKEIWDYSVYKRSIICGAYNGDTVLQILKRLKKIEAMACFEPDPVNFSELKHNVKPFENHFDELLMLPLGIYKNDVQLYFSSGCKFNSSISTDGDLMIQCVSLDSCLPKFRPTFISMDIEGSEKAAADGMKNIIKRYHPCMAICIYHSPDHLWEIPLLLHAIAPEYKFYLRNYTSFTSETVLYAK